MRIEEIFIDASNLPKPLSKEETRELFINFNEESRNKLIEHNIRLVLHEINKRFYNLDYDKKDLVSIGIIELIKAVDTYDVSKGYEFSTYAASCIDNKILKLIRDKKRYMNDISFEEVIIGDKDSEDNIKVENILADKNDFIENIEKKEVLIYLRHLIDGLNERDKKIIMLYFGFYDDKCYTEAEIASITKFSQPQVSRIISKIIKKFIIELQNVGLIELHSKIPVKKEKIVKKIKSIYEYFSTYTIDEVNYVISLLSADDKKLLTLRYGEDLYHPYNVPMNKKDLRRFYDYLIPKIKRMLFNSTRVYTTQTYIESGNSKVKKDHTPKKDISEESSSQVSDKLSIQSDDRNITPLPEKSTIKLTDKVDESTKYVLTEDFIKLLNLFNNSTFIDMINTFTIKEAIIITLKLRYVDGKYFSNEQIAAFFEISEEEVMKIVKKFLLLYKRNINQILDIVIDKSTIQSENVKVLSINNIEN